MGPLPLCGNLLYRGSPPVTQTGSGLAPRGCTRVVTSTRPFATRTASYVGAVQALKHAALDPKASASRPSLTRICASPLEESITDAALDPEDLDPIVSQVMNRQVICLPDDMPVRAAMQLFLGNGISGAPVVDKNGGLVGVLSETDIIATDSDLMGTDGGLSKPVPIKFLPLYVGTNTVDHNRDKMRLLLDMPVSRFMTKDPIFVKPDLPVVQAAKLMIEKQVNRLPVCAEGRVVGILTRGDVLQCMLWEMLMVGSSPPDDDI